MIPLIITALPILHAAPRDLPDLSWIPSDTCANTLCDLVERDIRQPSGDDLDGRCCVYNVANSDILPWRAGLAYIAQAARCPMPALVTLEEYVRQIQDMDSHHHPIRRLLPYFQSCLFSGGLPERYAQLDVSTTCTLSPSLAKCRRLDADFLGLMTRKLLGEVPLSRIMNSSSETLVSLSSSDTLRSARGDSSAHIFVFAPWTDRLPQDPVDLRYELLLERIRSHASASLSKLKLNT